MGDAPRPEALSLSNSDAAKWNRDLMLAFQAELQKNPEADLMSMFSGAYRQEHRNAQYRQLSYAGQINLRTLHELESMLRNEPEMNMLSRFPKNYNRRITMATGPKAPEKEPSPIPEEDFRTRLDLAETATVVFPLSEKVAALLAQYTAGSLNNDTSDSEKELAGSLKRLLWDSPKLWQSRIRGVVVKCNEDIVAKVIWGNEDYTEHTSMQFLAERAPDVPAPRAHGFIKLGPFRVIFMSYIPGTTLAEVWPSLSQENKLSIQQQLDDIFRRLRCLRQDDGKTLGGVCGEGAKDYPAYHSALFRDVTTATEFSDLQFSAQHHGSNTYVALLRSLLAQDYGSVFSHGDLRRANIIVKRDPSDNGHYIVAGIIDWEDSGFYPAYYECTTMTSCLSLVDDDDWFLYLPPSISPASFPVRFLVHRLWSIHLKTT